MEQCANPPNVLMDAVRPKVKDLKGFLANPSISRTDASSAETRRPTTTIHTRILIVLITVHPEKPGISPGRLQKLTSRAARKLQLSKGPSLMTSMKDGTMILSIQQLVNQPTF
jgi:hypothetical protein